ncbi:hypothetical protein [Affinirhizobium pseudoryzae]|uniref:hypothetical protein n=1 Tax=Allorhizobium pseudoryzae TaxID=379684 RepID=UPI003F8E41B6
MQSSTDGNYARSEIRGECGALATVTFKKGLLIRVTGDVIALSPPLIIEQPQIETIVTMIGNALKLAA